MALSAGGTALAQTTDDAGERDPTGAQAERAGQAALEVVGGGEVVRVERVNHGRAVWEVEVLKPVSGLRGWLDQTQAARRGEVLLDSDLDWIRYTNTGAGEVR